MRGPRTELLAYMGREHRYVATVCAVVEKDRAVLLCGLLDAVDNGRQISDHLWVRHTSAMKRVGVQEGDVMQFTASVKAYTDKSNNQKKYSLANVNKIRITYRQGERGK